MPEEGDIEAGPSHDVNSGTEVNTSSSSDNSSSSDDTSSQLDALQAEITGGK